LSSRDELRADVLRRLDRADDPRPLADYLTSHSNLPGPRGNLELAAAFAGVMRSFATQPGWHEVLVSWVAISDDAAPTNDPREFLPFSDRTWASPGWRLAALRKLPRYSRWRVADSSVPIGAAVPAVST